MRQDQPKVVRIDQSAPEIPAAVSAAFPGAWLAPWLRAERKLRGAGYGDALCIAFERAGPACAEIIGPEPAIDMAEIVSSVAIKSGTKAAAQLCATAPMAAHRIGDAPRFRSWLNLMQRFAAMAPESVLPVLERSDALLARLTVTQLELWLLAGIRQAGVDPERRLAFFAFETPDASRLLAREADGLGFFDMDRKLKAYLTALYGQSLPIREAPPGRHDGAGRRASFGEGFIQMPAHFPGFRGAQAEALFRAALAHVGAHIRFTRSRFDVGGLKPLQIAVVSLIEDARVEHLAMREMLGLRRLWLQFHIAQASGALTAQSRFARLARALIDPDFEDRDGWVRKGRDLFFAAQPEWDDPSISREIGNLLGNDLGQLRIQFNAKSHVVQPPYRDDNLGLWRFPEDASTPPQEQAEILMDSVRIAQSETPEDADRTREDQQNRDTHTPVRPRGPEDDAPRTVVARYPEYDYEARHERAHWTTVVEYPAVPGPVDYIETVHARHAALIRRLTAMIRAAKVSRAERLKRQADGEVLDLDACIEAITALRGGDVPDTRVYQRIARRNRDLSISLLLDVSASTSDPVGDAGTSILDLLREATVVLSHAIASLDDPFAVAAFCSDGREDVRYVRIKDFGAPFDRKAGAALAGLRSGYSTRLGAALRHAGKDLVPRPSHRRLVLLVSDGEPSDIDCTDPAYLIEDAKRAVQRLAAQGIDVFCVGLGSGNTETLRRIFGRRGYVQISSVSALPERLASLYLRLTT